MKRLLLLCVMWYGNIVFSGAKNSSNVLVVQKQGSTIQSAKVDAQTKRLGGFVAQKRLTAQLPSAVVGHLVRQVERCDKVIQDLVPLKERHDGLTSYIVEDRARTQEQVASLQTAQAKLKDEVDSLWANFAPSKGVDVLEAAQRSLMNHVLFMDMREEITQTQVASLQTAQAKLKDEVASFEAKFAPLTKVAALETAQKELKTAQKTLKSEVTFTAGALSGHIRTLQAAQEASEKRINLVVGCSVAVCSAMALFAFSPKTIPGLWNQFLTPK